MATLAQLQARIILDTARDDLSAGGELAQALADAIADAIETYADEQFWFNRASGSVATLAGTATIAFPAGMRIPRIVTCLGQKLNKVPLEQIERAAPASGVPASWADDGNMIRLYPTPDGAYPLAVYGIAELGVPAPSNAWTVEGYRLILGEAKRILFRGPLRDVQGMQLAADEADEALTKLRRETRRRGGAALMSDLPLRSAFNIVTGR
jgi:hypothetical protein